MRWFALEVVEAQQVNPGVDVLIGMYLIVKVDMTWLGPSRIVLINH